MDTSVQLQGLWIRLMWQNECKSLLEEHNIPHAELKLSICLRCLALRNHLAVKDLRQLDWKPGETTDCEGRSTGLHVMKLLEKGSVYGMF